MKKEKRKKDKPLYVRIDSQSATLCGNEHDLILLLLNTTAYLLMHGESVRKECSIAEKAATVGSALYRMLQEQEAGKGAVTAREVVQCKSAEEAAAAIAADAAAEAEKRRET